MILVLRVKGAVRGNRFAVTATGLRLDTGHATADVQPIRAAHLTEEVQVARATHARRARIAIATTRQVRAVEPQPSHSPAISLFVYVFTVWMSSLAQRSGRPPPAPQGTLDA